MSKKKEFTDVLLQDKINQMPRNVKEHYPTQLLMWFEYANRDYWGYFPFNPITKENVERLKKYGKTHILYNPKLERWVVSDKFKQ